VTRLARELLTPIMPRHRFRLLSAESYVRSTHAGTAPCDTLDAAADIIVTTRTNYAAAHPNVRARCASEQ
jgi:hypothetical protein